MVTMVLGHLALGILMALVVGSLKLSWLCHIGNFRMRFK